MRYRGPGQVATVAARSYRSTSLRIGAGGWQRGTEAAPPASVVWTGSRAGRVDIGRVAILRGPRFGHVEDHAREAHAAGPPVVEGLMILQQAAVGRTDGVEH